ncbi:hypothetical protein [Lactobacillus plantarum] [Lactiplantibacillus mudanjiangensis]|uniref:GNAT family N-acetyltransferase n=1 Tax=Lactiplantibacillus mudanjiangensis TaxID=1296538 RepID=UPI0010150F54|nr:GNAT family N-acetyltransferase [Lactiplantibacillus mudanjiangensis]VDG31105.1 hypothetical protein [Lactobacillus plantarum] [Lactiplantibacillus mudanjiangensis]
MTTLTLRRDQTTDRRDLLDLFLIGDDDEQKVQAYLQTGELYVAKDDQKIVGLALVIPGETITSGELKNIAVLPAYQGQGIGSQLLDCVVEQLAAKYQTLLVGTGDADLANIRFYLKNGFRFVGVRKHFFDSYAKPIVVNGIQLQDMVLLQRPLP